MQIENLKVFTDFHHASLLNSLIMLFEGRLGGQVYRPIGMEWAERGFWKVYDHPETQAQYLGIGAATPDGTQPLNEVVARTNDYHADIYHCHDIESSQTNKAITLEGFWRMPIDIVIASLPQHIRPFKRLCEEHPNHPKLIYQIGNQWNVEAHDAHYIDAIMASANVVHNYPTPTIKYHQEFDTSFFRYEPPTVFKLPVSETERAYPRNKITSFVNCFSLDRLFEYDWQLFQTMEKRLPEWEFRCYGGQCRDGSMNGSRELSEAMQNSRFIWHTKAGGDGYGHVIHNAAASGRPLIVRGQYYLGKMAYDLIQDELTCICIDGLGVEEIINKIEYHNEPERYSKMCEAMYSRFKEVVDFDKEAKMIVDFLQKLV